MKIGVFDSGVGGKSFASAIKKRFPDAKIIYKEDRENLPYGDKTPQELLVLSAPIFREFETEGADAVLVACNSITTNIISELRDIVDIPLVGVEPMIKPAIKISKTGAVAVCATPATLSSKRYRQLKLDNAEGVEVVEPDCSDWAFLIEHDRRPELRLKDMVDTLRNKKVDVIVLGCTHYHWIEDDVKAFASPDIQVIQPIEPVLDQLELVLNNRKHK